MKSLADIERTFCANQKSLCDTAAGCFSLAAALYVMKILGFSYAVSDKLPNVYVKWDKLNSHSAGLSGGKKCA